MKELRLPRRVEESEGADELATELVARARPLWAGADLSVAQAGVAPGLEAALRRAWASGRVVRGLDSAERALAAEERGLEHVDRRTGVERGLRVSRLLVMADDGAERFYRRVESLLRHHGPRVLALRLSCDERELGQLFGADEVARLLLIEHKDAVSAVLLALAEQWRTSSGERADG